MYNLMSLYGFGQSVHINSSGVASKHEVYFQDLCREVLETIIYFFFIIIGLQSRN